MSQRPDDPSEILRKLSEPIFVPDGPLDMPELKYTEDPPSDGELPSGEHEPSCAEPIWKRFLGDTPEGPPSNRFPF